MVERASVESCLGQADWPESVLTRATCNIRFGGAADATQRGEQARGDGDADRARIFARAYGKDPEFYAFYRSMQAYEAGLRSDNTRLVLPPDSHFFRFFAGPSPAPRSK